MCRPSGPPPPQPYQTSKRLQQTQAQVDEVRSCIAIMCTDYVVKLRAKYVLSINLINNSNVQLHMRR